MGVLETILISLNIVFFFYAGYKEETHLMTFHGMIVIIMLLFLILMGGIS